MQLRELILRWHHGVRKNAISDFAAALKVQRPRVSLWLSGRNWPDEDIQPKVCGVLGITADQLREARPRYEPTVTVADLQRRLSDVEARLSLLEGQRATTGFPGERREFYPKGSMIPKPDAPPPPVARRRRSTR